MAGAIVALLGCAGSPVRDPVAGRDWPSLARRAERARGIDFLRPVAVETVPSSRIGGLLRSEIEHQLTREEIRGAERMGVALGLLPPGTDLLELSSDFAGRATIGFYSPATQRLVVAEEAAAYAEDFDAVAVHELVHALQDQHTHLIETLLGLWEQDDLAFALGAQIEGDALQAEFLEASSRGRALPGAAEIESAYGIDEAARQFPEVPRLLRESLFLQYALGYRMIAAVHAEGGARARDALLAAPALSSEQLLHPEKRLDPAAVDWPQFLSLPRPLSFADDCVELGRTTLGELGLRIWLRDRGQDPESARGWDGDRLVVMDCGEGVRARVRVIWVLVLDEPFQAEALEPALRAGFVDLASGAGGSPARPVEPALVERFGARLWVTTDLSRAERASLRESLRSQPTERLEDFLAGHPDIGQRAARVRGPR